MMRGQISMPAEEMTDGVNPNLYNDFSDVAQACGVYTAIDYADIIQHLVQRWDIEHLEGLSSEAEKERDYICRLPDRYRKLAERSMNKKKKATEDAPAPPKPFSWIYGRTAMAL
jgi:acyl-[acyl-carrier-protein] desaturase